MFHQILAQLPQGAPGPQCRAIAPLEAVLRRRQARPRVSEIAGERQRLAIAVRAIAPFLWASLLAFALAGCAAPFGPPVSVVQRALLLETLQARQAIAAQFAPAATESAIAPDLSPLSVQELDEAAAAAGIAIERVRVTERSRLTVEGLPAFRVGGTYDVRVERPGERPLRQRRNPFSTYLQLQAEGKTWRLARPGRSPQLAAGDSPDAPSQSPSDRWVWTTYRLP